MEQESDLLHADNQYYTTDKQGRPSGPNNVDESDSPGEGDDCADHRSKWMTCLGYLFAILAAMGWASSAGCSQALGGYVPAFELNMFRFVFLWLVMMPIVIYNKTSIFPDKSHAAYLGIFCLLEVACSLFYYEASIYIPLGAFGGFESTCIILLTALVTVVFHRQWSSIMMVAILLSTVGIFCVTQPGLIFKYFGYNSTFKTTPVCVHQEGTDTQRMNSTTTMAMTFGDMVSQVPPNQRRDPHVVKNDLAGYLLSLGSSITYTSFINMQRKCLNDVSIITIFFWLGALGTVLSGVVMFILEIPIFPRSTTCIMLLLGHSLGSSAGICIQTASLFLISPFTFTILFSLELVVLLVMQYTVLSEINPGHRNMLEVVGVILVLFACISEPIYSLYVQWKLSNTDVSKSKEQVEMGYK